MIKINNQWHYEPLKGDMSYWDLFKALYRETGVKHDIKGLTREQRTDLWIYWFGPEPVAVPPSTLISVRDEHGRLM